MYTITPDQSLMTWALGHGWCSQRCDATTPVEAGAPDPIRRPVHKINLTGSAPAPSGTRITDHRTNILVVHGGPHDRACGVAETIAEAANSRGSCALVRSIHEVTSGNVVAADAVIVGCWVPGRGSLNNETTLRMMGWIEGLAPMCGKPVGLFCTYRFFPYTFADMATRTARMENELAVRIERKGARIVAAKSIYFKSVDEEAADLVQLVLEQVEQTHEPAAPAHFRETA